MELLNPGVYVLWLQFFLLIAYCKLLLQIILRDNQSFHSLGRRMFDVYIQGEQRLKDFDIEQEAKGVDKVTKENFTANVDFKPPSKGKEKIFISIGAAVLALLLVLAVICYCWWNKYIEGRISRERELRGLDLRTGFFTYRQIKASINNFDSANKIGDGGSGSVYKIWKDAAWMRARCSV